MSTEGARPTNEAAAPGELHWQGLFGNDTTVIGLDSAAADGARFLPHADVLQLPDGSLRYLPDGAAAPVTVPGDDPGALAKAAADRARLEQGAVPGRSAAEREVAPGHCWTCGSYSSAMARSPESDEASGSTPGRGTGASPPWRWPAPVTRTRLSAFAGPSRPRTG